MTRRSRGGPMQAGLSTLLGLGLAGERWSEKAITAHKQDAEICRDTGYRHGAEQPRLALRQVRRFEEAITACQDAAAIFWETADNHAKATAARNLENDRAAALREQT